MALHGKKQSASWILTGQMGLNYRADMLKSLIDNMDHILCYRMDTATAKIVSTKHPELITEKLIASEPHYFYTKLNIQTKTPITTHAKGIFPIPFPKK